MKDRYTDSPEDKPKCTQHPDACSNLYLKNMFKKLWFYITHFRCEVCHKWVDELYIYEYFLESGVMGCKECCNKKTSEL